MRLSDQVAEEQERGILLPTPTSRNAQGNGQNSRGEDLLPGAASRMMPTPTAADANGSRRLDADGEPLSAKNGASLSDLPTLLPTPTTEPTTGNGHARNLGNEVGGLLPTPTAGLGESGQTSRSGARIGERLLGGIAADVTLLPTPSASQHNDGEDAAAWQARRDYHANKAENATRAGMPLPIAVQRVEHDGEILDETETGELVAWGQYRDAIMRTQAATGRVAPSPTNPDGRGGKRRLSARFVEWMMLLEAGHVTDVPGLTRPEQLRMLGNGVVPDQAEAAAVILIGRACDRLRAARRDRETQ